MTHRSLVWPLLGLVALAVGGCEGVLGGVSAPTRHYVLSAAPVPAAGGAAGPTVGVSTVRLAQHLQHRPIVTRDSQNRVTLAAFDQWAAPLDEQITRTLAENLTAMIPSDRVLVLPASRGIPLAYRLEADIARFEREADGSVVLTALWGVFDGDGRNELAFGRSTLRETLPAPDAVPGEQPAEPDYDAVASAMSRALASLSREIAQAIRALPGS